MHNTKININNTTNNNNGGKRTIELTEKETNVVTNAVENLIDVLVNLVAQWRTEAIAALYLNRDMFVWINDFNKILTNVRSFVAFCSIWLKLYVK